MAFSAFILGAGFGTRLRPLTTVRPKPLMPVLGRPLIDYSLQTLRQAGIGHVMVNAHHLWEQMAVWAEKNQVQLQVEMPTILGTGGGLKAACSSLNETVIIWNGDILCDVPAAKLLNACLDDGAVMALKHTESLGSTTPLLHDGNNVTRIGTVCAVADAPSAQRGGSGFHFTGIHAMSRNTFELIPEGEQCVVRTAYKTLVPERRTGVLEHTGYWLDIGNPLEYWQTTMAVRSGEVQLSIDPWANQQKSDSWIHPSATVIGQVKNSVVESGAVVPAETSLNECIVWDDVTVPKGHFERCIFFDHRHLQVEMNQPG